MEEYIGSLTLPGEDSPRRLSLFLDAEGQAVSLRFDPPAAGTADWKGAAVRVMRRRKFHEVVFSTTGLPKETVALTWKCSASFHDGTLAGVVVARPNELRVTGEKGFILAKPL